VAKKSRCPYLRGTIVQCNPFKDIPHFLVFYRLLNKGHLFLEDRNNYPTVRGPTALQTSCILCTLYVACQCCRRHSCVAKPIVVLCLVWHASTLQSVAQKIHMHTGTHFHTTQQCSTLVSVHTFAGGLTDNR